jgi:tetratricopeptide (TPR) repeat protein
MAEAHLALAGALRGQGAAEFSLALTRLALRLRPGFAPALLLAADALMDERSSRRRWRMLDQVPADDPLAAHGRAAPRDVCSTGSTGPDEAAASSAPPRRAGLSAPQPHARLGDMLRGRSRWAEAAAAYDEALARPAPGPAQLAAVLRRGIALERAGRWPPAEADFRRALELSPEQPYVLNYLGYTWVERARTWPRRAACWNAPSHSARRTATSPTAWAGRCSSSATCPARSAGSNARSSSSRAAA